MLGCTKYGLLDVKLSLECKLLFLLDPISDTNATTLKPTTYSLEMAVCNISTVISQSKLKNMGCFHLRNNPHTQKLATQLCGPKWHFSFGSNSILFTSTFHKTI